jgi:HSP20 family molecular chaperone IbpA
MTTDIQSHPSPPVRGETTRGAPSYRPRVEIFERADELTLKADMPGVKSDSIDMSFEEGVLTISGRVEPRHENVPTFLLKEFGVGDFYRTFQLSEQIDSARIATEFAGGVLTVHLPKTQAAKPLKIEVRSGA